MDYNPKAKAETFANALRPFAIKDETKNWSTIKSYIYVISKTFNPISPAPIYISHSEARAL